MTEQDIQKDQTERQKRAVEKRVYQAPRYIVFGSIITITRGSGGDYGDECTSGKQPGDDEDA